MKGNAMDLSFSGLKTAVLRWSQAQDLAAELAARKTLLATHQKPTLEQWLEVTPAPTLDLLASFQHTVIAELLRRAQDLSDEIGARCLIISGGVAANAGLRSGDTILAINGASVTEQQGVIFGLLDAMSSSGNADLTVRSANGATRNIDLDISNVATRRHMTVDPLSGLGFQFWQPPVPPQLGQVLPDGPAARAGLQAGDRVVSVDGHPVKDWDDLVAQITPHPGGTISLTYERHGATHTVQVEVASVQVGGKYVGRIEAAGPSDIPYPPSMVRHIRLSPVTALGRAAGQAWDMTALQGRLFWRMLLGQVSLKNLSGPVSIAQYAGQSASEGASAFLYFLVLISLSLGFLNLLPIPILDGGQIVFQLVEWVKGSPMSERAQAFGQQVGIALLILLMGVALFNDIARQFS